MVKKMVYNLTEGLCNYENSKVNDSPGSKKAADGKSQLF